MDIITTALAFIVALGVLVTIHEYGHFWVARKCGVRVLRFSIGFGNPLVKWHDRHGTEYWIASIPLGGYVKMLDSREVEVPPEQLHEEFNQKNVWQRIAVFSAGPLVNLAFAVLLYWFMFVGGVETIKPVVGEVEAQSAAAVAGLESGDEIVAVDGETTQDWQQVTFALIERMGESGVIDLMVKSEGSDISRRLSIPVEGWLKQQPDSNPAQLLGITPYRPHIPPEVSKIAPDSPAESGGLQAGDRVVSVNGQPVDDWIEWVESVREHPGELIAVEVRRNGQIITLKLTPAVKEDPDSGETIGQIGAYSPQVQWPEAMKRQIDYSVGGALWAGVEKTGRFIALIFKSLYKMAIGAMSLDNISGPITIAQVAGDTASYGLNAFLNFMAYLSITLGVFNLLPIPMLDGGHILYALIEVVRGKPLSERVQQAGLGVGLSILAAFMLLAFYNDIIRLSQ